MAETEAEAPAAVLDASALLAHLNDEDGASSVRAAMKDGAAISVANWAEVLSKLANFLGNLQLFPGMGLLGRIHLVYRRPRPLGSAHFSST